MLRDWVTMGGNLIAARPDKQLASLLGITDASSVQFEAYLPINTAHEPGVSIIRDLQLRRVIGPDRQIVIRGRLPARFHRGCSRR
jgi:hypothetical protein